MACLLFVLGDLFNAPKNIDYIEIDFFFLFWCFKKISHTLPIYSLLSQFSTSTSATLVFVSLWVSKKKKKISFNLKKEMKKLVRRKSINKSGLLFLSAKIRCSTKFWLTIAFGSSSSDSSLVSVFLPQRRHLRWDLVVGGAKIRYRILASIVSSTQKMAIACSKRYSRL